MLRKYFVYLAAIAAVISLGGCATGRNKDLEIQGLRNQVKVLETELQVKDNEIMNLRESYAKELQEQESLSAAASETKERPTVRQIQAALKNAGYSPGAVDGKIGKQTREAIRAFQRANGLSVDGKVGKLTWSLLKQYLEKKVK